MWFLKLITLLFLTLSSIFAKAQAIEWHEDRPLVWTDFKGKPDHNGGAVAVSYWNTVYTYKIEIIDSVYHITFDLKNLFDANLSWRKRDYWDEYVLGHEQLHFDINELFTRKLAAAFHSAKFTSNYKSEIDAIYNKNRTRSAVMEALYDNETRHSNDQNMQYRWEFLIHLALRNLPRNY